MLCESHEQPSALLLERCALTALSSCAGDVLGLGVDLLDVRRVVKLAARHPERFAQRLLCQREYAIWLEQDRSVKYLAKQFAAKEAIAKALGTGIALGLNFTQLQAYRDGLGAPYVELVGKAASRLQTLGGRGVSLSLSDEGVWIMAVAIIMR